MERKAKSCFICGRSEHEVDFMIQGLKGAICERCIQDTYKMYYEEFKQSENSFNIDVLFSDLIRSCSNGQ